jgi:Flp pilus assembly protein TadD
MEVGTFNLKQKNYRGAELRFRSALEEMPNEPEAGFKLGKALEKQGKLVEARRQYERFLEHSKGGPFEEEARKALKDMELKANQRH